MIGLLPCVWQSLTLSKIVLSNMALASGVLWSLLLVSRHASWLASILLAILLVLSTRSGEYVSDGLLILAAAFASHALRGLAPLLGPFEKKPFKSFLLGWRSALRWELIGLGFSQWQQLCGG